MKVPSYMSQDSKGMITIDFSNVPDNHFLDANKTKEIAKFKFMSRQEKQMSPNYKPGGPDVIIQKATGEKHVISRKELVRNYVHASGNKIIIPVLTSKQFYLAYHLCDEQYKIIKLPNNCSAKMPNGSKVEPGSYIIARVNENGQIDKSSIASISSTTFRKMFKIPMQPAVKRHMGAGSKSGKMFKLFNKSRQQTFNKSTKGNAKTTRSGLSLEKPSFDSSQIGMNPANIKVQSVNDAKGQNMWKPSLNGTKPKSFGAGTTANIRVNKTNNKYRYKVTYRLTDINGAGVGYVVQDLKTGNTVNLKDNQLMQLCANKLVSNVMLVHNIKGLAYLQGNGISLVNLPKLIV